MKKQGSSRGFAATLSLLAVALVALVAAATALAAAPRSTSPPTIEGDSFREGETVRASNGIWQNNPTSFSYVWQRCNPNANTGCVTIAGATAQTYRLAKADVGRSVRVTVVARNADGSATSTSSPSPVIADDAAPKNTRAPSINGTPVVGQTLTADEGSWTASPDRYAYQWRQCDAAGSACVSIAGATGKTYGVRSGDVGKTLRVEVTAINQRGRATSISAQTAVVRASGSAPPSSGKAIPVASVNLPDRLVASAVSFTPTAIRNRFDFVTLRVRVNDTRGRLVQGALVYATGVPFGRITTMPEVPTGGNGVATLRFRPTVRLAIRGGTAVQIFIRVRKPGDSVLAGVSSRRLVQIRIVPG